MTLRVEDTKGGSVLHHAHHDLLKRGPERAGGKPTSNKASAGRQKQWDEILLAVNVKTSSQRRNKLELVMLGDKPDSMARDWIVYPNR